MKKTITLSGFRDAWAGTSREDSFSWEGLETLFDYFKEYEADTGEELELDIVAIDCDFVEYESLEEAAEDWGCSVSDAEDCLIGDTVRGSFIFRNE